MVNTIDLKSIPVKVVGSSPIVGNLIKGGRSLIGRVKACHAFGCEFKSRRSRKKKVSLV